MNPFQLTTLISAATAFTLNILLIPVILFRSSDRIGTYKYFLLAYTLNASFFALSQASTLPTWYIPPNGYIFVSTIDILPRLLQQVQIMSFVVTFTTNAIILSWCFMYRLAVIESPRPWITVPKYMALAMLCSVLFLTYIVASCWPIMPTDDIDKLFRDTIFNGTGVELSEVGYIGGEITINGSLNVGMAICLVSCCILTGSTTSIVLYCWRNIGSKLQALRSIATTQYNFQYKLYVLLTLQTIMPIIFNIIPAFIAFSLSLAKVSVGDSILVCGMIVSFAQIADPIFTILLVSDYRDAVLPWKRSSSSVHSVPISKKQITQITSMV